MYAKFYTNKILLLSDLKAYFLFTILNTKSWNFNTWSITMSDYFKNLQEH